MLNQLNKVGPIDVLLPDNGEGFCVLFNAWLDTRTGISHPGIIVMLLLGGVVIKKIPGKICLNVRKLGMKDFWILHPKFCWKGDMSKSGLAAKNFH